MSFTRAVLGRFARQSRVSAIRGFSSSSTVSRSSGDSSSGFNPQVLAGLREIYGDDPTALSTGVSVREQHGRGESWHPVAPPDAVVFPKNVDQVASTVKLCSEHRCPVIPYGTGTSLEGHVNALHGGVTIDLSLMNKVLKVNADDMDVVIQPGVTREQLNETLRHTGLFFPIDPGANASLGGMCATRASGTNAVKYGTMADNVLSMQVVLPSGEVIRTGTRARKSSAGYDLKRLFVGSEGTLGVVTEVALRVYGIPEATVSAVCSFDNLSDAVEAVQTTIQMAVPVARCEFVNPTMMRLCANYSGVEYDQKHTLFFEFTGSEAAVAEQSDTVKEIAGGYEGVEFKWATDAEERKLLWKARHDAYYACLAARPNSEGFVTDVCVPISRLAECVLETQKDIDSSPLGDTLVAPIVGHVGDGNFHVVFVLERGNQVEMEEAERLNERLGERAIAMGGTCTGEHGVGYGKRHFMKQEHGAETWELMKAIKTAVDPLNIMNPGKLV